MDGPGQAAYEFYLQGTADWQWSSAELRRRPADAAILHFGSIASWTPPGSERIDQLVSDARARNNVVEYDHPHFGTVRTVASPFGSGLTVGPTRAPRLGEQTAELAG